MFVSISLLAIVFILAIVATWARLLSKSPPQFQWPPKRPTCEWVSSVSLAQRPVSSQTSGPSGRTTPSVARSSHAQPPRPPSRDLQKRLQAKSQTPEQTRPSTTLSHSYSRARYYPDGFVSSRSMVTPSASLPALKRNKKPTGSSSTCAQEWPTWSLTLCVCLIQLSCVFQTCLILFTRLSGVLSSNPIVENHDTFFFENL
jgi:hypothetical protein